MKEFNTVVTGIGGQGVLTLEVIIAEAAMKQGYDVKTSELHGLAQRGGSIPCHIRFGEKIYSPLVLQGEADLIIGLEPLEALRAAYYGSKERGTIFLINSYRIIPVTCYINREHYPSIEEIVNMLKPFSKDVDVIDATEAVKTGGIVTLNIYMLGYAYGKGLIPLEREYLEQAMKQNIHEKYIEMNKRVFELGVSASKK